MGELEDRINSVLSDPEQFSRISALAQSLMGGTVSESPVEKDNAASFEKTAALGKVAELLRGGMGEKSPRIKALEALAPCLDEKRRKKLTRAMKLARVLRLAQAGLLGAEGGDV